MEGFKNLYSNHAVKQMFQRNISTQEVEHVLRYGETLMDYPDDNPYPSKLLFAVFHRRPLHIVCSYNMPERTIIMITVYEPSNEIWESDFKTRKNI